MEHGIRRREFLQVTAAGAALFLGTGELRAATAAPERPVILSPGSRKSKVRVAKVYLGIPQAHWPTPKMDIEAEVKRYEAEFAKREQDFADVEFVTSDLISSPEQAKQLVGKMAAPIDGILVIHLSMGITPALNEILAAGKPTMLFAAPYSGHEWVGFGELRRQPAGALLECLLTSDFDQLAVAVRPFRAIHHLREAKILNVTSRELPAEYCKQMKDKFGTEVERVDRERMLAAFNAVDTAAAEAETRHWTKNAAKIVEPSREEIFNSCRLALAFEQLMNEEQATAITVDCYGSMYRQLPAFPCIGFTRLNDMGLAGICESDLKSAMTFLLLQGLSGRPGFISDPTVDESTGSIILAHCLGSTKMKGPDSKSSPYKIRYIMERQEGAVTQVSMPIKQKVTQAILVNADEMPYFTGEVIEAPDVDRGCRTKITVKVDGNIETLWQNWKHGLHRVTCYGDLTPDLKRFCRFKTIKMLDEAAVRA